MKPRKPLKPKSGNAYKRMQANAKIRTQIDDENARHRAELAKISLRRTRVLLRPATADRAIALQMITQDLADENERNRVKLKALRGRINR